MPAIEVTPIYAALIAILMAVLATRVAVLRGKHNVALGHGDNRAMALAIRHFGNLSEYAAICILLLLLMELSGIAPDRLHAYGITLVVLRLLHPFILFDDMAAPLWKKAGRFVAAAGTAVLMMIGGVALLLS